MIVGERRDPHLVRQRNERGSAEKPAQRCDASFDGLRLIIYVFDCYCGRVFRDDVPTRRVVVRMGKWHRLVCSAGSPSSSTIASQWTSVELGFNCEHGG